MIEAILKRVKLRLGLLEMPLPAEYFDLIGGTSAGGHVFCLYLTIRIMS
jgi:patatin-like phospholipase/acyl hydrolase